MKLINPSDTQLDSAFAEHVAGIKELVPYYLSPSGPSMTTLPRFTQSADAVLPWLEKWSAEMRRDERGWYVWINRHASSREKDPAKRLYYGESDSLPCAAVICLLRAHGVEVEFTQCPK